MEVESKQIDGVRVRVAKPAALGVFRFRPIEEARERAAAADAGRLPGRQARLVEERVG